MKTATISPNSTNHPIFGYLLNAIYLDGYDYPQATTDKEKLEQLNQVIFNEKIKHHPNWLRYYGSYHNALIDWLQGAPSALNIPIYYCDIIALAIEMGTLHENASGRRADAICANYYNYMAVKLQRLFKMHKITPKTV